MKNFLRVVGFTIACTGCATIPDSSLKYSLADVPRTATPAHDLRVGVSWFDDARPRKNQKPPFDVGPVSGDIEKGKIGGHIAIVFSRHLQQANAFRETVFVGGGWKKKAAGFDAQLTGTVKSFYFFREYLPADKVANTAVMFGGVFSLIGAAGADQILVGLDRKYISEIILEDVKLVESGTGKTLWQGSVSKRLEGTTTLQNDAMGDNVPWKQALKQALTELVGELQSAKIQLGNSEERILDSEF